MNAREQARIIGRKTLEVAHTLSHGRNGEIAADAASDVWEPLLREVWGMADGSLPMDRFRLAEIKEML